MSFLRFVRYFEGMLARRELTLEGIEARTKVHVLGKLASPRAVASPVTPVRASVLTWALLHRYRYQGRGSANREEYYYRAFASETSTEPLLIETEHGTLLIPHGARLDLRYATPIDQNPHPLLTRPSPALMAALEADTEDGEVYYDERFLVTGDKVAVKGTVQRVGSGMAGPYRGNKPAGDFVLIPDAEVAKITELA